MVMCNPLLLKMRHISFLMFSVSLGVALVIASLRLGKVLGLLYRDLAKPKSEAPGLFILTGCRITENKRLWNCPPFGFPGYCLIM